MIVFLVGVPWPAVHGRGTDRQIVYVKLTETGSVFILRGQAMPKKLKIQRVMTLMSQRVVCLLCVCVCGKLHTDSVTVTVTGNGCARLPHVHWIVCTR